MKKVYPFYLTEEQKQESKMAVTMDLPWWISLKVVEQIRLELKMRGDKK